MASGFPLEQHTYRIFSLLKMELEGTLGANHSTQLKVDNHCSYSRKFVCGKELSTSVDEKSCFFNSYLIIGGYLGTA